MADPAERAVLRDEVDLEPSMDPTQMLRPRIVWETLTVARAAREENRQYEGLSIPELAQRRGIHKADAILDLALREDLKTQFLFRFEPESAFLDPAKAPLYQHPLAVPMNSDAGAHLASECKTGEGTYFLRKWVLDSQIMSLEDGIAKVTSLPARMIGLADRGVVREGAVADLMVFDPAELDCLDKEPSPNDLPGGEARWVQRARGVRYVLVNGEPTIWDGQETGALPGKVLRSGWYR
jgi:N-acyl-D-aspartate/D-glutamate deacylase